METKTTQTKEPAVKNYAKPTDSDAALIAAARDARNELNSCSSGTDDYKAALVWWERANNALYDYQVSVGLGTTVVRLAPRSPK